jgi:hypothetical protein
MKKKTRIASLKSLQIDKSCIMTLNAMTNSVVGGKDSVLITNPTLGNTTDVTQITACGCPPRMTQPPFCIF